MRRFIVGVLTIVVTGLSVPVAHAALPRDPNDCPGASHSEFDVRDVYYDYEGRKVNLYYGTTAWGYCHIRDRWSLGFANSISYTLTYPTSGVFPQGTAVKYTSNPSEDWDPGCVFTVIVEFGKKPQYPHPQNIITAYGNGLCSWN